MLLDLGIQALGAWTLGRETQRHPLRAQRLVRQRALRMVGRELGRRGGARREGRTERLSAV